jgi:hypothetical protein
VSAKAIFAGVKKDAADRQKSSQMAHDAVTGGVEKRVRCASYMALLRASISAFIYDLLTF